MSPVVVFEVAGQIRQAMARASFQVGGVIALDAYPYRLLDRGRAYLAVFAELSDEAITVVALGRVVPGDRSGVTNRNLEFDRCESLASAVIVPIGHPLSLPVRDAVAKHRALLPVHGEKLLERIAAMSPSHGDVVEALRTAVVPSVVEGEAGFVLACERDAVALSLKAANLTARLSGLSAWVGEAKGSPFISGLEEASDPSELWSYPECEVLPFDQRRAPYLGYMRVSRSDTGTGMGVTLVGARPEGVDAPRGVALVYHQIAAGSLTVLGYHGSHGQIDWWLWREIDSRYAGVAHPNDPRMVAAPGFVKEAAYGSFDAAATDRLLPGEIRSAAQFREWDQESAHRFDSHRHLSNSTFAALLGGGWLGGRAAGFRQVREVVDLLLRDGFAVVIAVHGHREPTTLSAY